MLRIFESIKYQSNLIFIFKVLKFEIFYQKTVIHSSSDLNTFIKSFHNIQLQTQMIICSFWLTNVNLKNCFKSKLFFLLLHHYFYKMVSNHFKVLIIIFQF